MLLAEVITVTSCHHDIDGDHDDDAFGDDDDDLAHWRIHSFLISAILA